MTARAPLDTFEAALLTELRQYVSTRDVSTRASGAAEPSTWRRRVTTLGAAAAAAVAITIGAIALRPEAAYAVDVEADGDVVVTIRSLEDADGLEEALADEGVEAVVEYDADPAEPPTGGGIGTERDDSPRLDEKTEPGDASAPLDGAACRSSIGTSITEDGVRFRLSASAVESDGVLHITTSGSVDEWSAIAVRWDGGTC
jgi:hypothetical protein